MKTNSYHMIKDSKPTGLWVEYVELVLHWKWMTNCGGTSHWKDENGKCRSFVPRYLEDLRQDQVRALIRHEKTRKEKKKNGL